MKQMTSNYWSPDAQLRSLLIVSVTTSQSQLDYTRLDSRVGTGIHTFNCLPNSFSKPLLLDGIHPARYKTEARTQRNDEHVANCDHRLSFFLEQVVHLKDSLRPPAVQVHTHRNDCRDVEGDLFRTREKLQHEDVKVAIGRCVRECVWVAPASCRAGESEGLQMQHDERKQNGAGESKQASGEWPLADSLALVDGEVGGGAKMDDQANR